MVHNKVCAGNVESVGVDEVLGAVAKLGQLEMRGSAQLKSGSDKDSINFDAGGTGELKVQFSGLIALRTASQHPSAAGQQRSGEEAN